MPVRALLLAALALGASCGSDDSAPVAPTARGGADTSSLPTVRFLKRTPAPVVQAGERREAATADATGPVTLEIEGGVLALGDEIAIDARLRPGGVAKPGATLSIIVRYNFNQSISSGPMPLTEDWSTYRILPLVPGAVEGDTGEPQVLDVAVWVEGDALLAAPRVLRPGAAAPTILLVTSDTHRADHVSTIDATSPVRTRHIDALGAEGAVFTNCWSSTNVTNPSHIALMTGIHPRDTKIVGNDMPLHESASTLAEHFRARGYQTFAAMSAFHLYDELSGLGQGFDRMNTAEDFARDGRETLEIAQRWLDDADGAPLFLWLHLFDPHAPYRVPPEIEDRLAEGRPDPRRADSQLPIDADHMPGWVKAANLTDADYVTALYGGEVEYLDGLFGGFLSQERMADATVAFTSDHGEGLGEQQIWWDHSGVYAPTLHVPLILRGPGLSAGARSDARVLQIDVGRTLLNMAGMDDVEFPGTDLRVALEEAPANDPRFALSANGASASIETEGWLCELYLRDDAIPSSGREHALGACYLYDLRRDPHCETDVLLEHFDRGLSMREALILWMGDAQATGLHPYNHQATEAQLAKLKELGYSGGVESILRWWYPEKRDPNWQDNPWCRAFADDGDASVLSELAND